MHWPLIIVIKPVQQRLQVGSQTGTGFPSDPALKYITAPIQRFVKSDSLIRYVIYPVLDISLPAHMDMSHERSTE